MEENRENAQSAIRAPEEVEAGGAPKNGDMPPRRKRRKALRHTLSTRALEGIDPHVVSLTARTSIEAEQYRTICSRLEQMHKKEKFSVIAITSPAPGDGKSMTAVNIAGTLAQLPETKVLLIDMDLRRPSVGRYLGFSASSSRGLVDLIDNPHLTLEEVINTKKLPFNLEVLPCGRPLATPHTILKSRQLDGILTRVRARYDYVILDLPPMLPFSDVRVLDNWIDGFVLVVAANQTPRKLVEEVLNLINPNKLCGVVLNNDNRPHWGDPSYHTYYDAPSRFIEETSTFTQRFAQKVKAIGDLALPRVLSFLVGLRSRGRNRTAG